MKMIFTNPMTISGTPEEMNAFIQLLNKSAAKQRKQQNKVASAAAENAFDVLAEAIFKKIDTEDKNGQGE